MCTYSTRPHPTGSDPIRSVLISVVFFGPLNFQGGGGPFAVLPYTKPGRFKRGGPLVSGHTASVLDFDFNPFHEQVRCLYILYGVTV